MYILSLQRFLAVVVLTAAVVMGETSDDLLAVVARARDLDQKGDYIAAEKDLLLVLREVRKAGSADDRLGLVLINLGSLYHGWSRWGEAKKAYNEAIHVTKRLGDGAQPYLIVASMNLVALYIEVGDARNAGRLWNSVLAGELNRLHPQDSIIPSLYLLEGSLRITEHKYGEADRIISRAIEMRSSTPAAKPLEKALAIQTRARARAYLHKKVEAGQDLTASIHILEANFPEHHPVLARTYNDAAGTYRIIEDLSAAERCYRNALHHANLAFGSGNPVEVEILAGYANMLRRSDRKKEASAAEERLRHIKALMPKQGATVDIMEMPGYHP